MTSERREDHLAVRPIVFGKFCLLEKISTGGMAEIYRAKLLSNPGFQRFLAVKRVLPSLSEDQDFITMFIDEAKISVEFSHPNICHVYELGRLDDTHYMVMEYIPGQDLLSILRHYRRQRKIMSVSQACFIVMQVANGLHHAHAATDQRGQPLGIIHRDVSPQNVLVSYEGVVKLIDFGVAKAATKNAKTQAGVLKGKFGYMSPEQAAGDVELDHRSDVFGLGTVLWELLTGRRLFHADTEYETLELVRAANVLPPSTFNHLVPPSVDDIVKRALHPDRNYRYQYASELAQALWSFISACNPPYTQAHLQHWMCTAFAEALEREWLWVREAERFNTSEDVRKHNTLMLAHEEFASGQHTHQTVDHLGNIVPDMEDNEDFAGERTHVFSSNAFKGEGGARQGLPGQAPASAAGASAAQVGPQGPGAHNITQAEIAAFDPSQARGRRQRRSSGAIIALAAVLLIALVGLGVAAYVLLSEPGGDEAPASSGALVARVEVAPVHVAPGAPPLAPGEVELSARLLDAQRGEVAALTATPDAEGGLRFEGLAPGAYFFELTHPAFVPVLEPVTLRGGAPTTLAVVLNERLEQTLILEVSPPELALKVDGQRIDPGAERGTRRVALSVAQPHTLTFEHPGFVSETRDLVLAPDAPPQPLTVTLEAAAEQEEGPRGAVNGGAPRDGAP